MLLAFTLAQGSHRRSQHLFSTTLYRTVLIPKYLKRISDCFYLFIWFPTDSFGCMHRHWMCFFVCYLKSHTLAAHTFIHSFTHAPTTTCRSLIKTTSSKWCPSALTSPSRSAHRLYGVYVRKPWYTFRQLAWNTTPCSHGPIKKSVWIGVAQRSVPNVM